MATFLLQTIRKALSLRFSIVVPCLVSLAMIAVPTLRVVAEELPDSPGAVLAQQDAPPSTTPATTEEEKKAQLKGEQSKRILGFIPNFRSVSVDDHVPPMTAREKFKLSLKNSFDYSTFLTVGAGAGISMWNDSYPEFGDGADEFGKIYWRAFVNQAISNQTTVFLVPAATHEDPRYFTLGRGSFMDRTKYALTRIVVTRKDSGGSTFNTSEILGRGSAAALSVWYYPSHYWTFSEVGTRWGEAVAIDAGWNCFKEFWPDIRFKLTGERK